MSYYPSLCRTTIGARATLALVALALLCACQSAPAPVPKPTPVRFTLMDSLPAGGAPAGDQEITTIGYVLVDQVGAALVEAIIFDPAGTPQPLAAASTPIWLGPDARAQLQQALRGPATAQYAAAIARGRLSGPGSFGPSGRYRYQLSQPVLEPIVAEETTIADLLGRPAGYESRLVRLVGGLLVRGSSALLVEQLGAGGLPAPKTQQIKLRGPVRDPQLLARLKGAPNGAVRFGQIQIEGLWIGGTLAPLAITIVT